MNGSHFKKYGISTLNYSYWGVTNYTSLLLCYCDLEQLGKGRVYFISQLIVPSEGRSG